MKKKYLMAPGPTPVAEHVALEMAHPMIHHRTPQFSKIFAEAAEAAKYLFQTKQEVMILASTGTGGMEGCVTNLFSPKDKVLVINGGKFGERWGKISESYGLTVVWHNVEWGQAADAKVIENILKEDKEIKALRRTLLSQVESYVRITKKVPAEVVNTLTNIKEPGRLVDTIVAHMSLKLEEKQKVLELINVKERLKHVVALVDVEIDMVEMEHKVRGRVKDQMEKSQKEYYLNEQMKAIQKELGDMDSASNELDDLENKIKKSGMSEEGSKKANAELKKLQMMSPMSAEATVVRNYLDALIDAPWKKKTKAKIKLDKAEQILEEDHYGLKSVKERSTEYLAVQQRTKKLILISQIFEN